MKKLLILVFVLLFSGILKAQEQTIPYNQNDRDRMVRVETKVETMQSQIIRLEDKFDSYFMWGLRIGVDVDFRIDWIYYIRPSYYFSPCRKQNQQDH